MGIWSVLGINETKDKNVITNAYREKLVNVNPEEDSKGFMELRGAYEEAIKLADKMDSNDDTPLGIWINKIDTIYSTYSQRIDENVWKEILEDDICFSLDTKIEARDELLKYLMDHYILPQKIWMIIDETFNIKDTAQELYEIFPKDYIDYGVLYNIDNPDTIDFDSFEIDDGLDYVTYIEDYVTLKRLMRGDDRDEINKVVEEMESLEIIYPYLDIEKAILCIRDDEYEKAEKLLYGAYRLLPNNREVTYLLGVCKSDQDKIDEALEFYNKLLDVDSKDMSGMGGKAYCLFMQGKYEEARDLYADLLDLDSHNQNAEEYYNKASEELVKQYTAQLESDPSNLDTKVELAWCLIHTKKIDEALNMLKGLTPSKEKIFRYFNILSHCYAIKEDFNMAIFYFKQWKEEIERLEDDGTEETKKHLKRYGYTVFRLGCCYIAKKDIDKALEYINKSIEIDPKDMMFYIGKAGLYLDEKEYTKAIDVCDEALEIEPENGEVYGIRLKAFYELGYLQECFDDCNQCIRYTPFFLQAYIYKIKVYLAYDEFDEAKNMFDYLKESGADFDDVDVVYGQYLITRPDSTDEDKKQAREIYIRIIEKYENSKEERHFSLHYVYYVNAIWLYEEDKTKEALKYIDMAIKEKPNYTGAYYFKGRLTARDKKRETQLQSIDCYKKVLEISPQHVSANCAIAEIYDDLNLYEIALKYHSAQLENEESMYYYVNRGLAYMALDRFDEARADYYKGLEFDPDNPHPYNNIGVTYQYEDQLDKAMENYLEGIKRINNDKTPIIYRNMVTTLNRLGRHEEALKYHDEVYNMFKRTYDIKEKAMTLRYAKRYKEAIKVYREWDEQQNKIKHTLNDFLDTYNGSGEYLYYVGECYCEVGDLRNAKKYYKKAAAIYKEAYVSLGEIYMMEGQYQKAINCFNKVTEHMYRVNSYITRCYYKLDKFDKALELSKKTLETISNELDENDNSIQPLRNYYKGILYLTMGEKKEAYQYFKNAYNCRKCNSCDYGKCYEAPYGLGMYYEAIDDLEQALKYYEEANSINDNYYLYKTKIIEIKKMINNRRK